MLLPLADQEGHENRCLALSPPSCAPGAQRQSLGELPVLASVWRERVAGRGTASSIPMTLLTFQKPLRRYWAGMVYHQDGKTLSLWVLRASQAVFGHALALSGAPRARLPVKAIALSGVGFSHSWAKRKHILPLAVASSDITKAPFVKHPTKRQTVGSEIIKS